MKNFLLINIIFLLLASCSEVYQPEIEDMEPFLVIEGSISSKPGSNNVYLNLSRSYNESPSYLPQRDAVVTATDDLGNVYNYQNMGNGVYTLTFTEGNTPAIGRTFVLRVATSDGEIYESTPQTIQACAPIRNLLCSYDQQTIMTEDAYGAPVEKTFDGINVVLESEGILSSDNFFLYSWKAYEEHHCLLAQPPSYYDIYRHRALNHKYNSIIHTVNADEYPSFQVRQENLFFIIKGDMTDYSPPFPDSFTLVENKFEGLIIKVQQKSISDEAYIFYKNVENQLAAEGHLFDPISPQLVGNMKCITNEEKLVVGIFYASDIAEKISYLYINERNRTHSNHLDSMPELWLDTCSWSYPESWISPPF